MQIPLELLNILRCAVFNLFSGLGKYITQKMSPHISYLASVRFSGTRSTDSIFQCHLRVSNPQSLDPKSDTQTTTPPPSSCQQYGHIKPITWLDVEEHFTCALALIHGSSQMHAGRLNSTEEVQTLLKAKPKLTIQLLESSPNVPS